MKGGGLTKINGTYLWHRP